MSTRPIHFAVSGWFAAALLAAFAWAGFRLCAELSITNDEAGHFGAGLSYWRNGGYSISTDNFFFTQKWATWPLARRPDLVFPSADRQRQIQSNPNAIGQTILVAGNDDPRPLIAPARRMTLLLAIALGGLVWILAARLGGPLAGFFAVLLYSTCPVVLANAVLVTSDLGTAFWYVAALGSWAWLIEDPGSAPAVFAGVSAGLLLLSKLSGIAFGPAAVVLLGVQAWIHRGRIHWGRLAGWLICAALIGIATLWAFFGFSYRPGGLSSEIEHGGTLIAAAARWKLLPEPFLAEVSRSSRIVFPRPAYLLGRFFYTGKWFYFPVAFLAKATLAMLASLGIAAIEFWREGRKIGRQKVRIGIRLATPLSGAGIFFALAMASSVNIGIRHILPVFPLVAVIGGTALTRYWARGRAARWAVAVLAIGGLGEGIWAAGRPQSWFNAAVGGPASGYRILVDSSLDWGGETPELVAWEKKLRTHDPATPIFFSDLGALEASYYGGSAQDIAEAIWHGRITPGYYVFSATRLICGPSTVFGPWTEQREDAWRHLLPLLGRPPGFSLRLADVATARIAAYCRLRAPLERIGPVYFVYLLDSSALKAALAGPSPIPSPSYLGVPER